MKLRVLAAAGAAALALACGGGEDGGAREGSDGVAQSRATVVERIEALIDSTGREVAVYYRPLAGGDSIVVSGDVRMHAASTMKVPVMMQLYLDRDSGELSLDRPVAVRDTFRSIADSSLYRLEPSSDSDTAIYRRVGDSVPVRELVDRMITISSNLATNILIEEVGAARVTATMRRLGADSIEVLRGVEDIPAYRAGMSNTTTARDLGVIFTALGNGAAAADSSRREMLDILSAQEYDSKIPARLPETARVAHKTGWITEISHDAGIVEPRDAPAYVVVLLTRGFEEQADADRVAARISRMIYDYHVGRHGGA